MIPNTVIERGGLSPNELTIYVVLSLHANNETRMCHPGFARIAEVAHVSRETVKRVVKSLESRGLVSIERRKIGAKNLSNVYTVHSGVGTERAPN